MGSTKTKPKLRVLRPRGSNSQAQPIKESATVHSGGAWLCQTALGVAASHCRARYHQDISSCASNNSQSKGSTAPSKVIGTTTRLIRGMAKALAMGETTETS